MLTVVIKDNGELNVTKLTYQNLWRELKDIPDSQLVISDSWLDHLPKVSTTYVCFVEADCLVNSGYFTSQVNLFKKNSMFRKLAMLSSSTAVNYWHNKFYGYCVNDFGDVSPIKNFKSKSPYPVQIGYVPGAIIRMSMLNKVKFKTKNIEDDLVYFSTEMSLEFWRQGDGNRTHINPNTTYVTTEGYVNDISSIDVDIDDLRDLFKKESI